MAKAKKRDKSGILTRTEKWRLEVSLEEEKLLVRISDALREYYNWAYAQEVQAQKDREEWKALLGLLFDLQIDFKIESKEELAGLVMSLAIPDTAGLASVATDRAELDRLLRKFNRRPRPKFLGDIDLYNLWKSVRAQDAESKLFRAGVPANWVLESSFKLIVGAYKSFFALVKNGDPDARPPRERPEWRFHVLSGCSAFSLKGNRVVLAPEMFGKSALSFLIPATYQAKMLARSVRIEKFIISRSERDLRKPGKFWISVSYEIPKPDSKPSRRGEGTWIALGASSIGIVWNNRSVPFDPEAYWGPRINSVMEKMRQRPQGSVPWRQLERALIGMHEKLRADRKRDWRAGELLIALERPDKLFKPKADCFEERMKLYKKGSREWLALRVQRRKALSRMANVQTLDRREIAAFIFSRFSPHVVVTELVIRSKDGKLADASKEERGGSSGLNWSVQNTGAIGYLSRWLMTKAPEHGGSVRTHKLPYEALPQDLPEGHENKILIARALRDNFLESYPKEV